MFARTDTPTSNQKKPTYVIFGTNVHIQTPLDEFPKCTLLLFDVDDSASICSRRSWDERILRVQALQAEEKEGELSYCVLNLIRPPLLLTDQHTLLGVLRVRRNCESQNRKWRQSRLGNVRGAFRARFRSFPRVSQLQKTDRLLSEEDLLVLDKETLPASAMHLHQALRLRRIVSRASFFALLSFFFASDSP